MTEKNNAFSELIPNKKPNKEKNLTKLFTIELIIYNNIYENKNKKTEEKKDFIDKEKLLLEIPIILTNNPSDSINEYYIQVDDLKQLLKEKGYPITTSSIYIYDENIIKGSTLINDKDIINSSQINNDTIKLNLKNYIDIKLIDDTYSTLKKYFVLPQEKSELNRENSLTSNNVKNIELNKRTRKIGEVVRIVYSQRKYFNGYYNDEGENVKYNLEEASKMVGVKRKTLDDYLKQLRKARENGFDFNKYKNESIAYLRSFNEKNEEKNKTKEFNFEKNIKDINNYNNNDIDNNIDNNIDDNDYNKENNLELEEGNI